MNIILCCLILLKSFFRSWFFRIQRTRALACYADMIKGYHRNRYDENWQQLGGKNRLRKN